MSSITEILRWRDRCRRAARLARGRDERDVAEALEQSAAKFESMIADAVNAPGGRA